MRSISGYWQVAIVAALLVACGGKKEDETAAAASVPEEKVVNVFNWSDYVGETTVADFEKKTGIKVTYDVFDSNEVLETKLLSGRTGLRHRRADRAVPRTPDQGRRVPEARQVEDFRTSRTWIRTSCSASQHTIRATNTPSPTSGARSVSATTRIWSRKRWVRIRSTAGARSSSRKTPQNWRNAASHSSTRRPTSSARSRSTRVSIRTARNRRTSKVVEETLMKIRPYVRYFHSSSYINDLAAGEICLALGWSGDVLQARDRGAVARNRSGSLHDPEGRRDQLFRHARDPGRCAASG